jgi:excisionase family DNA binding protein
MKHYSAHVELAATSYAGVEKLLEQLDAAGFHPAVGFSPRGWLDAQITFPATSIAQATLTATAVLHDLTGLDAVAATVMTEEEFDAREGFVPIPDLLSVTEVAELLGISRGRVLQLVDARQLEGSKIGNTLVIPRTSAEARQRAMAKVSSTA